MPTGHLALDLLIALGVVGAGLGGVAAIYKGVRWVWRGIVRVDNFLSDFHGEPARPGVSARPGVMERLRHIEGRLDGLEGIVTNGLCDTVTRIDASLGELRTGFDEHVRQTGQPMVKQDFHVAKPPRE